jgi:hypothetical protein
LYLGWARGGGESQEKAKEKAKKKQRKRERPSGGGPPHSTFPDGALNEMR